MDDKHGDDITERGEGENQERLLHVFVVGFQNQQNHERPGNWNAEVFADSKQLPGSSDAGKLGDCCAEVGDKKPQHRESSDFDAKTFANEIRGTFAGDRAHARRHFEDDHFANGDDRDQPYEAVAEREPATE